MQTLQPNPPALGYEPGRYLVRPSPLGGAGSGERGSGPALRPRARSSPTAPPRGGRRCAPPLSPNPFAVYQGATARLGSARLVPNFWRRFASACSRRRFLGVLGTPG